MEQEAHAFHTRVQEAFLDASREEWQVQHPEIGVVEAVDASGSADDVLQRCLALLAARWPERFASLAALEGARG